MSDKSKPAYPHSIMQYQCGNEGMSLREYYIGCALMGLCANREWTEWAYDQVAEYAITQADAVIAALEKEHDAE